MIYVSYGLQGGRNQAGLVKDVVSLDHVFVEAVAEKIAQGPGRNL